MKSTFGIAMIMIICSSLSLAGEMIFAPSVNYRFDTNLFGQTKSTLKLTPESLGMNNHLKQTLWGQDVSGLFKVDVNRRNSQKVLTGKTELTTRGKFADKANWSLKGSYQKKARKEIWRLEQITTTRLGNTSLENRVKLDAEALHGTLSVTRNFVGNQIKGMLFYDLTFPDLERFDLSLTRDLQSGKRLQIFAQHTSRCSGADNLNISLTNRRKSDKTSWQSLANNFSRKGNGPLQGKLNTTMTLCGINVNGTVDYDLASGLSVQKTSVSISRPIPRGIVLGVKYTDKVGGNDNLVLSSVLENGRIQIRGALEIDQDQKKLSLAVTF